MPTGAVYVLCNTPVESGPIPARSQAELIDGRATCSSVTVPSLAAASCATLYIPPYVRLSACLSVGARLVWFVLAAGRRSLSGVDGDALRLRSRHSHSLRGGRARPTDVFVPRRWSVIVLVPHSMQERSPELYERRIAGTSC